MKKQVYTNHDNSITVSVILPVYNVAPWIGNCIDSLKRQKLHGLEFIFVDDCSTDDSLAIVREFAAEDSRVIVVQNDENMGPGPSRNRGIDMARGEYLSFIDPDDWISDDFYDVLYGKAKERDCDIAKAAHLEVEDSSEETHIPTSSDFINKQIAYRKRDGLPLYCVFSSAHQSAIYKSSLFSNTDIRYGASSAGEDSVFLLKVCTSTESIVVTDTPTYYYRRRYGSVTENYTFQRLLQQLSSLEEIMAHSCKVAMPDEYCTKLLYSRVAYYLSCYYYAIISESSTDKDQETYYNRLTAILAATNVQSPLQLPPPELEVFLKYKKAIPCRNVRRYPVFDDNLLEWIAFMKDSHESEGKNYCKGCAQAIIRYIYSALSSRKRNNNLRKQFASLPIKTRLRIIRNIPSSLLSMAHGKHIIGRLRNG